jgi:hypothetical protein
MTRSSARDLDSAVIVTVPAAASRAVWTPSIGESYYLHVPKTEKGETFCIPKDSRPWALKFSTVLQSTESKGPRHTVHALTTIGTRIGQKLIHTTTFE